METHDTIQRRVRVVSDRSKSQISFLLPLDHKPQAAPSSSSPQFLEACSTFVWLAERETATEMDASASYNQMSSPETEEDGTKVFAVEILPADDDRGSPSKYGEGWEVDLSRSLLPEPGTIPEIIPEIIPEDLVVSQAAQTLVDIKADISRVTTPAPAAFALLALATIACELSLCKYGEGWEVDLSGSLLPEPGTIPEIIPEIIPEDPVVSLAAQTLVDIKADSSRVTTPAPAAFALLALATIACELSLW